MLQAFEGSYTNSQIDDTGEIPTMEQYFASLFCLTPGQRPPSTTSTFRDIF